MPAAEERRLVATAIAPITSSEPPPREGPTLADGPIDGPGEGERIGRHHIVAVLGEGGMGSVYDAYDPELDRRLAIKVLRSRRREGGEKEQDILLAEGQAMARVSHPNVIQVYDVGTHGGQVYVAMERLGGGTLGAWLARETRSWRAIVGMFVQAGRGLAAAHATGLVHLDFKPENVLLGVDGRPRVLDFGIAQLFAAPSSAEPLGHPQQGARSKLAEASARSFGGTPAYMAPEQFLGAEADARADQFAFCVALYEALAGARPFPGESVARIACSVLHDPPLPLPATTGAPRYVAQVLQRGLAREADERFASMDALLAELDRDPHRTRKRVAVVSSFVVVAALAGGLADWRAQLSAQCSGGGEQLIALWNPDRAATIAGRIEATKLPYAAETSSRLRAELDRYTQAWTASYTENCEATNLRQEQSESAMDLRLACLQRARLALGATVELLTDADEELVDSAQPLVDALPDLRRCDDLEGLQTDTPKPTLDQEEQVAELRGVLAQSNAALTAGRYEIAAELAQRAHDEAGTLDYGPLEAEATLALARAERSLSRLDEALGNAEAAISMATRWSQWSLALEAGELATATLASSMSRGEEAMRFAPWLAGVSERLGTADARMRYISSLAKSLRSRGDYEAADPHYREAVALAETAHGKGSIAAANALQNLAGNARMRGEYEEALELLRASAAIFAERYGPLHPSVVKSRWSLAELLQRQARYAEAAAEHEWVLRQRQATHGERGPKVMRSHVGLSGVYFLLERYAEAEAEARAALAVHVGDASTRSLQGTAYNNLGNALEYRGDLDGAAEAQRAALAIQIDLHAEDHPTVAVTRSALGLILEKQGAYVEAEVEQRTALALLEAKLGADHPNTANVRSNLGRAVEQQGRLAEALALQREALAASSAKLGAEHPQTAEIAAIVERLTASLGRR